MSGLVSLKIVSAFLACVYIVSADKIQLFDYSQNDSKTKCGSGVLLNVDQSGFRSVIQLDNSVGDFMFVKYEIKEELKPRFEQLLTIDLAKQCKLGQIKGNTEFSCRKVSEKEYHVTVLVKALREYSNATVRAFFSTDDPNNKRVQLPMVYEPTHATGQLIINEQDTSCYDVIHTSEQKLEFQCVSSAKPCVIEIHVGNAVESQGENNVVLERKTKKAEELYVTIKYAACRLDGENVSIKCRINMTYSEKDDHHDNTSKIIGIVLGIVGFVVVILAVGLALYKFTRCFGIIKPKPVIVKVNIDAESHSADTALLKKSRIDDDKTVNVSDTTEDKVKPRTLESKSLLIKLAELNDFEAIFSEIKKGADVNATWDGLTALMIASEKGHENIVKLFIEYQADVNMKTPDGKTALQLATEKGHAEIAELLIQNGADVNATWDGLTVLMIASEKGHENIVKLLIEYQADVNMKTPDGKTALQLAPEKGHAEIAELLRQNGADVNATWDGLTALMIASEKGHENIVKLLIEYQADVNMKTPDGKTALQLATEKGHAEIAELLRQNGATLN